MGVGGSGSTQQWRFNGANLTNSTRVYGATSAGLVALATTPGDAGSYDCVAVNAAGSVTSSVVTLTVDSSKRMVIVESATPDGSKTPSPTLAATGSIDGRIKSTASGLGGSGSFNNSFSGSPLIQIAPHLLVLGALILWKQALDTVAAQQLLQIL